MSIESAVRVLAGSFVLASLVLFLIVGPWGLALALFVGLNLIQSAFTGFCPAEKLLAKAGVGRPACGSCES